MRAASAKQRLLGADLPGVPRFHWGPGLLSLFVTNFGRVSYETLTSAMPKQFGRYPFDHADMVFDSVLVNWPARFSERSLRCSYVSSYPS
jgi:hypothetical protein